MSSVVRVIVMWLIVLAIHVQGMAAVVMPLCTPAHHSSRAAPGDSLVDHHIAAVQAAAPADHSMHHGPAADDAAVPGLDDGASPGEAGHAGHGMLKCCSAACSMAALMSPSLAPQVRASEMAPLPPVAQHYRGVTPDGLERPPKFILA